MPDHDFIDQKITHAAEALATFDATGSRDNANTAAWACHRVAQLQRETGMRFTLPARLARAMSGFVA